MGRLFGTDGVRGIANTELTASIAFRLGQAAVCFLGRNIVIGKDTRLSGDMLEAAVAAGITSMGGTALLAGIIPTPAIAYLTRELLADGGIVISASHNPPEFNGIKFFDSKGVKLSDAAEDRIEEFVVSGGADPDELPSGDAVGIIIPVEDAPQMYIDFVVASVEGQGIDFAGLKIALDTGCGASSATSPEAFRRLGADVEVINDESTGFDINVGCGSTCLAPLRELMQKSQADIGIAHDGDADRVMMLTPDGVEIDGDMIEAVLAIDLKERGLLAGDTVVSTVMCNLGFVHAMRNAGIEVVKTQVGDRYVLEAMNEQGFTIGGEQSGHVILRDYNSTGDGLLVAAQFLAACRRKGLSASEAARVMEHYPQVLINVREVDKDALPENQAVASHIAAAEEELGDEGRVLVRPSGTEPVVRVMVEASDGTVAQRIVEELVETIEGELSLNQSGR